MFYRDLIIFSPQLLHKSLPRRHAHCSSRPTHIALWPILQCAYYYHSTLNSHHCLQILTSTIHFYHILSNTAHTGQCAVVAPPFEEKSAHVLFSQVLFAFLKTSQVKSPLFKGSIDSERKSQVKSIQWPPGPIPVTK